MSAFGPFQQMSWMRAGKRTGGFIAAPPSAGRSESSLKEPSFPPLASTSFTAEPRRKAIRLPSGDHAGSVSKPSLGVSRVIVPPARGAVQISPWYEKARVAPSGDSRGWIAPMAAGNFPAPGFLAGCSSPDPNSTSARTNAVTSAAKGRLITSLRSSPRTARRRSSLSFARHALDELAHVLGDQIELEVHVGADRLGSQCRLLPGVRDQHHAEAIV